MAEILFLALGSNVGDPVRNLLWAIERLTEAGLKMIKPSGIYLTEPVGYLDQPDFYNMVIKMETDLEPRKVLEICQAIEVESGRVREIPWGPRTLDIDILFFGERLVHEEDLQIPHPRLKERAFVLVPLREIAPDVFHQLGVVIPPQKVVLLIESSDVTMELKKEV
ncbi:MAG: 2-amino-4-hydroxy-6-hydroxymethyldihydropteridine diphosphokinase [Bacillota bacterium]|uniref:2-amino-4-hydroxy-6-hydroxymethyldihydropteridine diphosphokinase n=1 Tax=Thermanaerosceptrum fracticalcis TaxID=1712410 RepID=A0A7G6E5P5_THEFR|nr:2-amino-4-hydroxy-6-hydroxymethyldihydropteridine diphosphokinase [Thermanaerosceptrum fracticalcis]QNB47399.1 2-amino-4-hydroxy-6-hydroxymethyldihydropteridine diphosphokinase [Thermanaerosceptrum fracticalcis]